MVPFVREVFSFPDSVNEVSARLVASGVVALTTVLLVTTTPWLLWPLAYGFVARVLTGPSLSPLGQIVTRLITPRLPFDVRPTAGPPKRFAQFIGATLSVSALVAHAGFGATSLAYALVAMITVAASLEAFAGYCLGCRLFAALMAVGLIPATVCEACTNLDLSKPNVFNEQEQRVAA